MPSFEIAMTLAIGSIIRNSSKAEVKENSSKLKKHLEVTQLVFKKCLRGHNNVSEKWRIHIYTSSSALI